LGEAVADKYAGGTGTFACGRSAADASFESLGSLCILGALFSFAARVLDLDPVPVPPVLPVPPGLLFAFDASDLFHASLHTCDEAPLESAIHSWLRIIFNLVLSSTHFS